ncbi:MAG TPA: hypothetical protein H9888_04485 [Candidatus Rikenella faecigallinarum]|uniref:Uncharacterized protein n=1 Tax=Candidatus Rikenella faecigallinarum TaxID=2838745 RepID=A0A9D1TYY2_9BACT|nr:hypothetical protein [Candidatus Rikenella faecigallinarum]
MLELTPQVEADCVSSRQPGAARMRRAEKLTHSGSIFPSAGSGLHKVALY